MDTTDKTPLTLDEATKPAPIAPDMDVQAWHDEQTRQAIKEAEAGDFVSAKELKATVRKFVPNG